MRAARSGAIVASANMEGLMERHPRTAQLARLLGLAAGFCLAAAGIAYADGGDKSNSTSCPPGQVYDGRTMSCVQQRAGVLPDKDLADYAYVLAKAERYREAIVVLNLMQNPNTAEALNYRGYATRKLGRLDEGIGYYLQSVALDPHYALVREYLGEAYMLGGDTAKAKAQLIAIKGICGTECAAYEHLAKAIEEGPNACGSRYAAKRCASQG
jgi:tetratricopeptide (TPR) repeat protein